MSVEIMELASTWGCAWREANGPTQYGFRDIPGITPRAELWLDTASGAAVENLIVAGLGTIIATKKGAYGGPKRTVAVDIDRLNAAAEAYWEKCNAADEATRKRTDHRCHYCGMPASERDFFDAWACSECR